MKRFVCESLLTLTWRWWHFVSGCELPSTPAHAADQLPNSSSSHKLPSTIAPLHPLTWSSSKHKVQHWNRVTLLLIWYRDCQLQITGLLRLLCGWKIFCRKRDRLAESMIIAKLRVLLQLTELNSYCPFPWDFGSHKMLAAIVLTSWCSCAGLCFCSSPSPLAELLWITSSLIHVLTATDVLQVYVCSSWKLAGYMYVCKRSRPLLWVNKGKLVIPRARVPGFP